MPALSLSAHRRRLLAVALACLVAVVLGVRQLSSRSAAPAPLRVAPLAGDAAAAQTTSRRLLVVDVAGAVRRPGLYRFRAGSRVADAVTRAGGLTRRADRAAVNLAAPLADGEQVLVVERGAGGSVGAAGGAGGAGPVSLSSATAEQLDALPGIGPATAAKIVAFRRERGPFRSVDELDAVPGIGAGKLADLKGLVVP